MDKAAYIIIYIDITQLKRTKLENKEVPNYSVFIREKSRGFILRWKVET